MKPEPDRIHRLRGDLTCHAEYGIKMEMDPREVLVLLDHIEYLYGSIETLGRVTDIAQEIVIVYDPPYQIAAEDMQRLSHALDALP